MAFDAFVSRLTARLSMPDLADKVPRALALAGGSADIRALAMKLTIMARQHGFDAEGDVIPFAVLAVIADQSFRTNPVFPWVQAAMNADACSGEERIIAIRHLLPERERRLCFGDDDRTAVGGGAVAGALTIHSSGNGLIDGHSWIEYTPDGGVPKTYGTWGNNPTGAGNGLFENLEIGRKSDASRTMHIDDAGEAQLMAKIDEYKAAGDEGWDYLSPCSTFAADSWESATGETLAHRSGPISNPTKLKQSIQEANGGTVDALAMQPTGNRRSVDSSVQPCAASSGRGSSGSSSYTSGTASSSIGSSSSSGRSANKGSSGKGSSSPSSGAAPPRSSRGPMMSDLFSKMLWYMLGGPMQVEAKDVIFREVTEVTVDGRRALRLQGLVFHSSLAVDKVSIDRHHGIAHVYVTLVPTGKGRSGNFQVDVPLDGVSKVLFGPAAAQLWPTLGTPRVNRQAFPAVPAGTVGVLKVGSIASTESTSLPRRSERSYYADDHCRISAGIRSVPHSTAIQP